MNIDVMILRDEIKSRLPGHKLEALLFERQGDSPDSVMIAWGLHRVLENKNVYKISKDQGVIVCQEEKGYVKQLDLRLPLSKLPPKHAKIHAIWDKVIQDDGRENNILGGNGCFITREESLIIPVIEATEYALAYYGATLLSDQDLVSFDIDPFPIWAMRIGKKYVDDFLMKEKGGGFYLEYHNDKPHFHMPMSLESDGFYILGREITPSTYVLTGFKIPFGKAVYTSGGTIHCDAALTGTEWLVGYSQSEDFSTVCLRSQNGVMTRVIPKV